LDIGHWLHGLGLQEYEPTFRANEIDAEILPKLTAEDLTTLGVRVVGHRRKLLEAIADLKSRTVAPREARTPAPPLRREHSDPTRSVRSEAERRQLTVMFCDLVGSTALASRLDPEDLREVIGVYHRCVAEIASQFSGFVAKYMGDGVLVYFGYPHAQEDAAERAVQAGLALLPAVGKLQSVADVTLQTRVGIATGPVVVGDLIGSGAAQEQAVVGETPNLAARLQALAEPNTIVIAGATRRMIGGLFVCIDLGAVTLKGFAAPVPAWRVLAASQVPGRFEALRGEALTPLTGRELELDRLTACWRKAREGNGQLVLMSGEGGIGKSRLLQALLDQVSAKPHALRYFCSPHHQSSPLHPFIEHLERAAGFDLHDTAERKLDKLETLLGPGTMEIGAAAPIIAALLSIPVGDRYAPLAMSAQHQKELTFQVLFDQLAGIAARQPVLILFEDAHWIDPSSVELLRFVMEHLGSMPVLLLVTFRPEFTPPWPTGPGMVLHLSRLDHAQSIAFVEQLTRGKPLPSQLLNQIVSRGDGVPLFLEELTRTVLESGLLQDEDGRWVLTGPLPPLAVPATLQDSLMARLDRLAPVKEVAQIGAVIGREFSQALLAAVAQRSEEQLQGALNQLHDAGLLLRRTTAPVTYGFKHALIQDAAYGTLLRDKRRQLHARVATVLEERFPQILETEPEMLARHCAAARMAEKAIGCWLRAGERAARRSADLEAISHFQAALAMIGELADSAKRAELELRLLTALGPALMSAQGWYAPEVESVYARARQLAQEAGRLAELYPILWGKWMLSHGSGGPQQAFGMVDELFDLARHLRAPEYLIEAHHAGWSTRSSLGHLAAALQHTVDGTTLYHREAHGHYATVYGGHDPAVCGMSHRGRLQWLLGYPDKALTTSDEVTALAEVLGHKASLAHARWYRAELHVLLRKPDTVLTLATALSSLASEQGLPSYQGLAMLFQGWALAMKGVCAEALEKLRSGVQLCRAIGISQRDAASKMVLVSAYARMGETVEALKLADEVLDNRDNFWEQWVEPEVHRLKGDLLMIAASPDQSGPEASYRQAIEGARANGARSWELRAAISLAGLWRDQGKVAEAHDLLLPICGWFTEGFDTPDFLAARKLLEELR
jgi:class 3 adenylate cyclase/predicted ATPase